MEVQCEFKFVDWRDNPSLYTCVVTDIAITKPGIKISRFVGEHLEKMTDKDVLAIEFSNTTVEYFPCELNIIFPGLIAIDIDNCGLKELLRENLFGWDLSEFYCGSNNLKKLPDDLFEGMKNLKSISFKGNKKLSTVASKLVQTIKENLSYVDFRDNSLIDELYEPGRRKSVASLDVLIGSIDKNCKKPAATFEIQRKEGFVSSFFQGRENLLNTGRFSDMKICVGDQELRVHKAIVINQCDKFDDILKNHLDWDRIELNHIRFDSLERFVRFLYTGTISIDELIIFDLFKLTDPTQHPEMKKACEKVLKDIIDEENAHEILAIAEIHGMKNLKKLASEVIKNIRPEIEVDQPEDITIRNEDNVMLED